MKRLALTFSELVTSARYDMDIHHGGSFYTGNASYVLHQIKFRPRPLWVGANQAWDASLNGWIFIPRRDPNANRYILGRASGSTWETIPVIPIEDPKSQPILINLARYVPIKYQVVRGGFANNSTFGHLALYLYRRHSSATDADPMFGGPPPVYSPADGRPSGMILGGLAYMWAAYENADYLTQGFLRSVFFSSIPDQNLRYTPTVGVNEGDFPFLSGFSTDPNERHMLGVFPWLSVSYPASGAYDADPWVVVRVLCQRVEGV